MVQYLGVDYLQVELEKRKQYLNDETLTIPEHLNHVEGYAHLGQAVDDQYRQPWTRVCITSNFVCSELSQIKQDVDILCEGKTARFVELYGCEHDAEHFSSSFDLHFNLSSPNFNSPDLLDVSSEDIIVDSSTDIETFTPVDLSSVMIEESNSFSDYYMEKIDCDNLLGEHLKKLPTLKTLSSCLHLKQVKDPICGSLNKLNSIESLSFNQDFSDVESSSWRQKESCLPQDIINIILKEQQDITEGYLSPVIEEEKIYTEALVDLYKRIKECDGENKLEQLKVTDSGEYDLNSKHLKYIFELEKMNVEHISLIFKSPNIEIDKFDVKTTTHSRERCEGELYYEDILKQEIRNGCYLENPIMNGLTCSPISLYPLLDTDMGDVNRNDSIDRQVLYALIISKCP